MKIKVRAPVRIDLAGGWTDVSPFTSKYGGEVVNLAINIYAETTLAVDSNNILQTTYTCAAPIGSGLGTTGAINVSLTAAIRAAGLDDNKRDGWPDSSERCDIAERAFQIEAALGNRGGRQDQWAAALGGWNHLMFVGDNVELLPFEPRDSALAWLQKHLILVDSGIKHVSGDLHESIWQRFEAGDADVEASLLTIRQSAKLMAQGLQQDRRDYVMQALRDICAALDTMAPELHDPFRPVVDPLLTTKTIAAWKALGAGGGGVAALLCQAGKREKVEAACSAAGWSLIDWQPDTSGLTITFD